MIDSDEETVRRYLKKKEEIKKKMAKNLQAMDDDDEEMQQQDPNTFDDNHDNGDDEVGGAEKENEFAPATATTVVAATKDTSADGAGDHKDEEHRDESVDVVLGLPTDQDLSKEVRRSQRRRNTRKKSVSCPENMLFVEALEAIKEEGATTTAAGESQDQHIKQDDDQSTATSSTTDDGIVAGVGAGATVGVVPLEERITMRRRRRKSQTLSCPAHMLFAEADRHLNSNYFFG